MFIDPEGKPVYLRGLNHYGDGSHMPWNLEEKYGSVEAWQKDLPNRLEAWGFNFLPTSIGPAAIDPGSLSPEAFAADKKTSGNELVTRTRDWTAEQFAAVDFPFTIFLEYPKQYMSGNGLPDVFSQKFRDAIDQRCREIVKPLAENKQLIGYHFTHNPPWHPRIRSFDLWINDIVKPGSAALEEWIGLMQRIYGSIDRWRETYGYPIERWEDIGELDRPLRGFINTGRMLADREAFMRRICREWYRTHHETIRKYDQNHLILGDRNTLHLQPLPEYALYEMKPYINVLSVNVMGPPDTVYGVLEQVTRTWDGPIFLADTGSGIYEGEPAKSTYTSRDLKEYEEVYRGMMTMGLEHPQIVGVGWCGYYETPFPSGRSGLVLVETDEPIPERLEVLKRWNAWMEERFPSK